MGDDDSRPRPLVLDGSLVLAPAVGVGDMGFSLAVILRLVHPYDRFTYQSRTKSQQYLDNNLQGKTAGDADVYYGYYNIDVLLNGSTYRMLSVNGYTGEARYHTWHGAYLQTATL